MKKRWWIKKKFFLQEICEIDAKKTHDSASASAKYEERVQNYLNLLQNYNFQCEELWLLEVTGKLTGYLSFVY